MVMMMMMLMMMWWAKVNIGISDFDIIFEITVIRDVVDGWMDDDWSTWYPFPALTMQ